MNPNKPDTADTPLDQNELQKLPPTTMAKNMRDVVDIMADHIAGLDTKLSADEERLLDRVVHEKTGKHLDKFKEKTPAEPSPTEIVIGKAQPGAPNPTYIGENAKAKPVTTPAEDTQSVSQRFLQQKRLLIPLHDLIPHRALQCSISYNNKRDKVHTRLNDITRHQI